MADDREFTTLPRRALGDRRLSGMDLRVLGAISLHDGLSLGKGKGHGCYAGDRKLAQTANTDRKNVKRSTARLLECGYLMRDTDTLNRRGFVMRVIPDNLVEGLVGGEVTPSQQGVSSPPIGGEVTPSVGGEVTPRIEREESQEENHKIDSAEAAHVADRDMRSDFGSAKVIEFPRSEANYDRDAIKLLTNHLLEVHGSVRAVAMRAGVSAQSITEAQRGNHVQVIDVEKLIDLDRLNGTIAALLPERFAELSDGAQVAIIDRVLKERDYRIDFEPEFDRIEKLLTSIADPNTPTGRRAQRLIENLLEKLPSGFDRRAV